jgi:LysR family transcriptional regulator, low CO2-responsive transcriptional regulator
MFQNLPETRHLQVFLTVAETNNMRRASKHLFMTPSAVSHAIKGFEEYLGYNLFDRSTRTMVLTREGSTLLPHAVQALEMLGNIQPYSSGITPREVRMHIGASPTACQFLIPAVIRELKESVPSLSIKITQGSAAHIANEVYEGRIDLGIGPRTPDHRSLSCTTIARDSLAFIVNPMHPWARAGEVNVTTIPSQRFVLAESRSFTKSLIDSYFKKRAIAITPFIEIGNEEVIKELVRLDIGVGIFPRWIASHEIERGLLVALPLGRNPPAREWVVCHRSSRALSFSETLFVGMSRLIASTVIGGPIASG